MWSVGTFQQSFYCVSHISACLAEVGEGANAFCLEKDLILARSRGLKLFGKLAVKSLLLSPKTPNIMVFSEWNPRGVENVADQ